MVTSIKAVVQFSFKAKGGTVTPQIYSILNIYL